MRRAERAAARMFIRENSMPVPFTACWLWLRGYGSHGYGAMRLPGAKSMTTAPRVAFEAWHGTLRRGEVPRHTCDSKWCCNPDHLVRGSHTANMRDKFKAETNAWWCRWMRGPLSSLDVLAIRDRYEKVRSSRKVGEEFGITKTAVMLIVNRKVWTHI